MTVEPTTQAGSYEVRPVPRFQPRLTSSRRLLLPIAAFAVYCVTVLKSTGQPLWLRLTMTAGPAAALNSHRVPYGAAAGAEVGRSALLPGARRAWAVDARVVRAGLGDAEDTFH